MRDELSGGITHQSLVLNETQGSGITGRNETNRSFRPNGLKPLRAEIFKAKGLSGSEDKSAVLIEQYAGNPLA